MQHINSIVSSHAAGHGLFYLAAISKQYKINLKNLHWHHSHNRVSIFNSDQVLNNTQSLLGFWAASTDQVEMLRVSKPLPSLQDRWRLLVSFMVTMWGALPEACLMFFMVVIRMLNQKFPDKQFNSLTTAQQRLKHPAEICHDNLLTGSIAKEIWNLSRRDNNQPFSSGSSSDAFLSGKKTGKEHQSFNLDYKFMTSD